MKKKTLTLLMMAVLCIGTVFAGEESHAATNVIDVYSSQELTQVLKGEPGGNGPITVRLNRPQGTYDSRVDIPKNVTLDMNGQTVNGSIILNGSNSSVKNGTVNGAGVYVRSDNPNGTISNITVRDSGGAGIYVEGASIGDITNNTIDGADGTGICMYKNATCGDIKGNTIRNTRTHGIAVFGHKGNYDRGSVAGDITDNTLTNCGGSGIALYYGSHCGSISRNNLSRIGGANESTGDYGIIVSAAGPFESYAKEITYNTVDTVTSAGIVVFSGPDKDTTGKWQDNGHVKGDIAYNTVTNCPTSQIKGRNRASIYVDNHARVYGTIHHNTVDTSINNGIAVISYSRVGGILSNEVRNVGTYGIIVGEKSKASRLNNNKVTMNNPSKGMAIIANTKSSVSMISGNNVNGKYHTGIRVKSPTGKVTIKGNTLKTSSPKKKPSTGISCERAKKLVITKNRITGNKTKPGIYLLKCKGTVKSNTIKKCSHKVYKAR